MQDTTTYIPSSSRISLTTNADSFDCLPSSTSHTHARTHARTHAHAHTHTGTHTLGFCLTGKLTDQMPSLTAQLTMSKQTHIKSDTKHKTAKM